MNFQDSNIIKKQISWGSIIAGIFSVMAIFFLLFILGASLGISMISPQSNDVMHGADTTVLVWTLVSILISLGCGAFVTGRLAGVNGSIHGFLVWATSLILSIILGSMIISSMLNFLGNTLQVITSTTGTIISGIGSASGNGLSETLDLGKKTFRKLDINTNLDSKDINQNVIEALKKSNIPALHPDFLASQLDAVKKETKHSLKKISLDPDNTDAILTNLTDDIKKRIQDISQSINRDDIEQAITNNTNLTPKEAEHTVNNIMAFHQKTVQEAHEKLTALQNSLQDAKDQFNTFKQQAKEKAEIMVRTIARLSFWSFIALLVGALVSAGGGLLGAKTVKKENYK